MRPPIRAVAIGVPARNEAQRIERCLRALGVAAGACGVDVFLTVAADRCRDDTVDLARGALPHLPANVRASVVECHADGVGAARELACRHAVSAIHERDRSAVWLAVTDADSVVPAAWLTTQLRWASVGLDGVAGLVTINETETANETQCREPAATTGFAEWSAAKGTGMGHPHVYAANMGVRASFWDAVGGFAPLSVGEDADLWCRLAASGARLLGVDDPVVATSGRTVGRTPGGFAGLMTELVKARVSDPARESDVVRAGMP